MHQKRLGWSEWWQPVAVVLFLAFLTAAQFLPRAVVMGVLSAGMGLVVFGFACLAHKRLPVALLMGAAVAAGFYVVEMHYLF